MLTLDAVRTAVLSDQPWARLDELVRAELSAGQTTRQIYKSLMKMADEIDTTPGLTEDGSDALGDTLDALTGYCRPEYQYKNPSNTALPTEAEIAELPRWARVAFAARCARRVLPLFQPTFPPVKLSEHAFNVRRAIEVAEIAASRAAAVSSFVQPEYTAFETGRTHSQAASVAASAAYVDEATKKAHLAEVNRSASLAAQSAAEAYSAAIPHIRRDFDHLSRLAEWQHWTDDTPVPPEVFGPLWPEGPPKGWPPITDVRVRADLPIELFARERATEQMIEDDVVNLFNALNRYHIARSGVRLTLADFHILVSALIPAEA